MSDLPNKPQPLIDDLTRPFWTAAREGRFVMQKCGKCGTVNFHPKPWCIECGCRELEWADVEPTGTIYSFTVSHTVAMNFVGWKDELPVLLGLIDLDDGGRMYAQVTDVDPEKIHIGMRVEAYLEQINEEAGIPKFKPVGMYKLVGPFV